MRQLLKEDYIIVGDFEPVTIDGGTWDCDSPTALISRRALETVSEIDWKIKLAALEIGRDKGQWISTSACRQLERFVQAGEERAVAESYRERH